MTEHPIEGLMNTAMSNIRQMIDVNTIIGNPIQTIPGTLIVPVSKVSFGFASGGAEYDTKDKCNKKISIEKNNKEIKGDNKENYPFGGGSGATVSIKPIGFLVIQNETVKLLNIEHDSALDKIFDYAPEVINKVNSFVDKLANKKQESENKDQEKDKNQNNSKNEKISYEIEYDSDGNTVSENIEIEDE